MEGEVKIILSSRARDRFAKAIEAFGPGAWEAVKPVLEGSIGSPLGGAQIISPRDVARISRALGEPAIDEPEDVVAELLSPKPVETKLRVLFARAARAKDHLLVYGRIPIQRPKRAPASQPVQTESPAERDARLVGTIRRSPLTAGLLAPNEDERQHGYWDLRDFSVFDADDKLQARLIVRRPICRRRIVRELLLLLLWASHDPARFRTQQFSALLLGEIAAAIGRGGAGARPTQKVLNAEVEALGPQFLEVFRTSDASSRVALALVAARIGTARTQILAALDAGARSLIRAAYNGESPAYEKALESVQTTLLGG